MMRRATRARQQLDPGVRAGVAAELQVARRAVPGCTAALVCSFDGLIVAYDQAQDGAADLIPLAAAAADLAAQCRRSGAPLGNGGFVEVLSRTADGVLAVHAAGPFALLAMTAGPGQTVGLLQVHARRAAHRVAEMLLSQADRP